MPLRGKVIITCAVTGSIHTPTMSPHLPLTPYEIARDAIAASEAGRCPDHNSPSSLKLVLTSPSVRRGQTSRSILRGQAWPGHPRHTAAGFRGCPAQGRAQAIRERLVRFKCTEHYDNRRADPPCAASNLVASLSNDTKVSAPSQLPS